MKVSLATAWLICAAAVDLGVSLQCYTCSEPMDVRYCLTVTHCPENTTACKTTVHSVDSGFPFFGNITVSKSCSKTCVPSEPDTIGDNHPDYCCHTDLCNVGAGQAATVEFGALSFTVILAVSLLWLQG
ncbi:secreted Ly-6/uPAR-related protein 1-like [Crotalus tigris]|uniref:secreted Ly-6/uPAR-related protein 1-like n=1 Tax=Crotalus tigris TaxID=88082 RepID=UPI00192F96EB|nr:secreted Ly-6/uPAR-related protein 1-like [Crotalus tigris]